MKAATHADAQEDNNVFIVRNIQHVWSCKISKGWINLAKVREIIILSEAPLIVEIIWDYGECTKFNVDDSVLILESWEEYTKKYMDTPNG